MGDSAVHMLEIVQVLPLTMRMACGEAATDATTQGWAGGAPPAADIEAVTCLSCLRAIAKNAQTYRDALRTFDALVNTGRIRILPTEKFTNEDEAALQELLQRLVEATKT